jgi:radical SAM protein with 4Fe4S-binding SPASM domain
VGLEQNANRSVEECVDKVMFLRQGCLANGIENTGSWTTAYDYLVNGNEDGVSTFCRAVRGKNVSVNPEGRIFVCGHTTTVIGDLEHFEKVFAADGAYASLIKSRMPGVDSFCTNCDIEGMCAGQCHITREVARTTGNGRLGYLCEFFCTSTRRLLETKLQTELEKLSPRR